MCEANTYVVDKDICWQTSACILMDACESFAYGVWESLSDENQTCSSNSVRCMFFYSHRAPLWKRCSLPLFRSVLFCQVGFRVSMVVFSSFLAFVWVFGHTLLLTHNLCQRHLRGTLPRFGRWGVLRVVFKGYEFRHKILNPTCSLNDPAHIFCWAYPQLQGNFCGN